MKRMIGVVACAVLAAGCGVFGGNDGEERQTSSDPDAAAKDPPNAPPLSGTPDASELNERLGVFVTENGSDEGDGSRAHPFATVTHALASAKAAGKRVYVCQGTYRESLVLEDGIPMVGGLDCSVNAWRVGNARARILAPESPAMRAENVKRDTRIEGFEVVAPDATAPSASSIALLASGSPGLVLARSRFVAGRGSPGAPGTEGIQLSPQWTAADSGTHEHDFCANKTAFQCAAPVREPGGSPASVICAGAAGHDGEPGGWGGSGGVFTREWRGTLGYMWVVTGAGNGPAAGESRSGAKGENGVSGASAAGGSFTADGFVPGHGAPGSDGRPGAGGRGGDGSGPREDPNSGNFSTWTGNAGAGGGAGGCPGLAGTPGSGGGASIGVYLVESPARFVDAEINASNGGAGGAGTFGSNPSAGSAGATAWAAGVPAAFGVSGGAGGGAGVSGSGAGGPSIAIAHTRGAPTLERSTTSTGSGGDGVTGATSTDAGGNVKTLAPSASGKVEQVLAF